MTNLNFQNKLPKKFYTRDALSVANDLLGKYFVRKINGKVLAGKIVEVEAYDGAVDEASHTFRGKTKRNEIMFEEGGFLYVYFTYGVHFCCNVVAGKKDEGKAVLIRGIEPLEGLEILAENRFGKNQISEKEKLNLTSGPGKICQAFDIARDENGLNLLGDKIFLLKNRKIPEERIVTSRRIGIKKAVELPWRFYIKDNPYVSKR